MRINDSTVIHEMEVSGKMVEEVVDNDKMVIDHLQSPLKSVKSYVFWNHGINGKSSNAT